jgi:hypothetical protein
VSVRIGVAALCMLFMVPAHADEAISVAVDQATLMRLPERATTLVIGNPLIADVTLQGGGLVVVTGKGYGTTNFIALDRTGAVLLDRPIRVIGPKDDVVVVYKGPNDRETYSCHPRCERRPTLGDSADFFNATVGQIGARSTQASGASAAATAPALPR